MKAYVFTDEALTRHAGRFVWLSLDTEKETNAAVKKALGVSALPTFFIVDSADEHVAIRWVGGGSVAQMSRLMDAGIVAVKGGRHGDAATQALVRADRAYGEEKYAAAIPAYREALDRAPRDWPGTARVIEALLFSYSQADQPEELATLARKSCPELRQTPSAALVASSGLDGALQLKPDHPERQTLVAFFEAAAREVLADPSLKIAGDDLSGLYFSLESARDDAKDTEGKRSLQEKHLAMLEREAAAATTPEQRAVYDPHRVNLYLALGSPEKALPMLLQSERDLPEDYNPPARLVLAYKALKQWPDALAASDRALKLVYGPRRLVVLQARADVYLGKGDLDAAKKTLADAVSAAEAMPQGQRSQRTIDGLKKKLAGIGAPATP